jgi:hypothetical protein
MSIQQPPVRLRPFDRPPEDIDTLLRSFMRAEMPDAWPGLPTFPVLVAAPPQLAPAKSRRWPWLNSRFALAATVSLCLVGSLSMKDLFRDSGPLSSTPAASQPEDVSEEPSGRLRPPTNKKPTAIVKTDDGKQYELYESTSGNTDKILVVPAEVMDPMDE